MIRIVCLILLVAGSIISCKKNCTENIHRLQALRILSPIENDSFTLSYDPQGKVNSVTRNGNPYADLKLFGDSSLMIIMFRDTVSGTIDTFKYMLNDKTIKKIIFSNQLTYTYHHNSLGSLDSVTDNVNGAFYNYQYLDANQKYELHYKNRVMYFCGFPSQFCFRYFSDTVIYEDNLLQEILPDQFIFLDNAYAVIDVGINPMYLAALNGYNVVTPNTTRLKTWTAFNQPPITGFSPIKYTIKYFYIYNTENLLKQMRTETYDAEMNLVFYRDYFFYYSI